MQQICFNGYAACCYDDIVYDIDDSLDVASIWVATKRHWHYAFAGASTGMP